VVWLTPRSANVKKIPFKTQIGFLYILLVFNRKLISGIRKYRTSPPTPLLTKERGEFDAGSLSSRSVSLWEKERGEFDASSKRGELKNEIYILFH
jgi:hypothetical protein